MSDPIVTPDQLGTFLGVEIDENDARGEMLLADAQALCESILTPLPVTAAGIIRRIAARAWTNPTSAHSMGLDTAQISYASSGSSSYGIGGLYLSKSDKADLRRLGGRGGAFSIDLVPVGTSGVQEIWFSGTPSGNAYTLTYAGQTTGSIALAADPATLQAALEALSTVGFGNVAVSGGPGPLPYSVRFTGTLAQTAVSTLTASDAAVHIIVKVDGAVTTQSVQPWDFNGVIEIPSAS